MLEGILNNPVDFVIEREPPLESEGKNDVNQGEHNTSKDCEMESSAKEINQLITEKDKILKDIEIEKFKTCLNLLKRIADNRRQLKILRGGGVDENEASTSTQMTDYDELEAINIADELELESLDEYYKYLKEKKLSKIQESIDEKMKKFTEITEKRIKSANLKMHLETNYNPEDIQSNATSATFQPNRKLLENIKKRKYTHLNAITVLESQNALDNMVSSHRIRIRLERVENGADFIEAFRELSNLINTCKLFFFSNIFF